MTINFGDPNRPNSYIGKTVPRPNAPKLVQGRGRFVDDITLPRMLHVAYLRSPHAHARIVRIESAEAAAMDGVRRIFTGADLADVCTPWVGVLDHLKGLKSAPQRPLPIERTCWVGEPVVAVVADSRVEAEAALARIEIDYEDLPVVVDMMTALDPQTPVIHPELGDNLAFRRLHEAGDVDGAMASAHKVVSARFKTGRHTGVTLEPRGILADWNPGEGILKVWHGTQAPHMMQTVFAAHLGLDESRCHVICPDVGGSFGIKVHVYPDEVATAAIAKVMGRPVKFVADRIESFISDIHARDHEIDARIAVDEAGKILAIEIDDWTAIGPYSVYPRTSAIEASQVVNLTGGPYDFQNYRAQATVVFQNKAPTCQYRAVGHPIAATVTEGLVDLAAEAIGMDPVEIRRRNLIRDDAYPYTSPTNMRFEGLSHHQCIDKLMEMMDYEALRRDQAEARKRGIHRGIGVASFIELTNPSPFLYGIGGARISAQEGVTVRMDPDGSVVVMSAVTEQGQGTEGMLMQVAAEGVGITPDKVRVITGDTQVTPYGGGTWASRGAGAGGEAALQASIALKDAILEVAGTLLQAPSETLDIRDNHVTDRDSGEARMPLSELGRIVYFRGDTLPKGLPRELVQTRHFITQDYPFAFTNGVQGSYVEVDADTGFVKLLKLWCVEDCGRIINPQLVDEQIRGGIVQGLGGALYEECLYDESGQMLNASMADYLVPMAAELPDMILAHVETPTQESLLGAKGAGEAGTAGAPAVVMNAINDAIRPLGGRILQMPMTPERILRAIGTLRD